MEKIEQLEVIVKESGLQLSEGESIKQSYAPYFEKIAEIKEQTKEVDFENPKDADEKKARELRFRLVKIRTGSEKVKNERKKIHSLKANLEQSAWNLIKSTCLLDEEAFAQVEKRKENERIAKIEALQEKRAGELAQFEVETIPDFLGTMEDSVWNNYITGVEVGYNNKKAEEEKAEADRIEAERKAEVVRNRRLKVAQYKDFIDDVDSVVFLSNNEFTKALERLKSAKKADDVKREKIRIENEKLKKQEEARKEKEAKAKAVREAEAKKRIDRAKELQKYIVFIRDYEGLISKNDADYKKEFLEIKKGAEQQWELEREKQAEEAAKKATEIAEEAVRVAKIEADLRKGDDEKMKDLVSDLIELKSKYKFKSKASKELYRRFGMYIDKLVKSLK